jgi:hypothetical protein
VEILAINSAYCNTLFLKNYLMDMSDMKQRNENKLASKNKTYVVLFDALEHVPEFDDKKLRKLISGKVNLTQSEETQKLPYGDAFGMS